MIQKNLSIFLLVALFATGFVQAESNNKEEAIDCDSSNTCTFVLLTPENELIIHNKERADKRFTPFSTFKIPNSVIALDTGVARSLKQTFTANLSLYPTEDWWPEIWINRAHNLPSAYKYSVVPIYRKLAADIGEKAMQQYISKFNYGNQDISSGLDSFWLNGSMQISAVEQVNFLEKLFTQRHPLNPSTYEGLKTLMHYKNTENTVIYAKTGTGPLSDEPSADRYIGWLVGVIEKHNQYYYFAINTAGSTFKDVSKRRVLIAKKYLAYYLVTEF